MLFRGITPAILTAHLLRQHDHTGGERCSAHTRDGEELSESCKVRGATDDLPLLLQQHVNVEKVPSCLDLVVPEADQRAEGLWVAVLLHEPPWGLRAHEDENREREGRDECRA